MRPISLKTFLSALAGGSWVTRDRALAAASSALVATLLVFSVLAATSTNDVDVMGRPLGTDFSSFHAAGAAVLAGEPDAPYDPPRHHARQQAAFGAETPFYAFQYPPFFLLIAAPLALLPYMPALLAWQATTLLLYLLVIRATIREHARDKAWLVLALGFPAVFITLGHGQNAFLSAALLGGGLVLLDRRPIIAGVLFGLLAYKPQLGVMLPVVLMATGRWQTFAAAAATVGALMLAVVSLLGVAPLRAFSASLDFTREMLLEGGDPGWEKIQTAFAWARLWGAPINLAYAVQAFITVAATVALVWLWRNPVDYSLKAAGLAIASVLATPFSVDYDMTLLAIAIAFLAMDGMTRGFGPWQKTVMAALWLAPLVARIAGGAISLPLGTMAMFAGLAFVLWRAASGTPAPVPR